MSQQLQNLQKVLDNWIGLDYLWSVPTSTRPTFPPYDIIKKDNTYTIAVALAGYTSDDISVTQIENMLVIESTRETKQDDIEFVHKGIARRSFKLTFNISSEIKVDTSKLYNGMLYIDMHREIPETKQPRKLEILTS